MYEQASERWSPVQSVEKVILSVISMLAGTSWPLFLGRADCAGTAYPRGGYHHITPSTTNTPNGQCLTNANRAEPRERSEHRLL